MRAKALRSTYYGFYLLENLGKTLETRTHSHRLFKETCLVKQIKDLKYSNTPTLSLSFVLASSFGNLAYHNYGIG